MNSITEEMRQKMGDLAYSIGYGHIGDGNLHLNVCCYDEKNYQKVENIIEPYIFHYLRKVKGSISAEHGLGIMKNEYLGLQKDKTVIEFMQKIKDLYDPNHILNPYKVL
jgi:FAD/FMN-containing dehydrogenase